MVVGPPSGSHSPQAGTEMVPPPKPHRTPPDTAHFYRNPPRGSSRARILSPSRGDFDAGDNDSEVAEGSTTIVHSQRGFWCVIANAAAEDPKPLASDSASRVVDQVNKCATGNEHHQPAGVQSNMCPMSFAFVLASTSLFQESNREFANCLFAKLSGMSLSGVGHWFR